MDVEGFELEIITASSLLKSFNYDLFIEFHSNILGKTKSLELLNHLKNVDTHTLSLYLTKNFQKQNKF